VPYCQEYTPTDYFFGNFALAKITNRLSFEIEKLNIVNNLRRPNASNSHATRESINYQTILNSKVECQTNFQFLFGIDWFFFGDLWDIFGIERSFRDIFNLSLEIQQHVSFENTSFRIV